MRRLLSLLIALLIAVTSQQMALARGQTHDGAGQVVLCTGQGAQVITVDRNGQPVDLVHICPDCALAFGPVPGAQAQAVPVVIHSTLPAYPVVAKAPISVFHSAVRARAPPVSA